MPHSSIRPKRPTQKTAVATPKSSSLKGKLQKCENVSSQSQRQGPQKQRSHNHSLSKLENSLKTLSLSNQSSPCQANDTMFSIIGKNSLHFGKSTRWLCSSSIPKTNLRSSEPILRDDAFKCLLNRVAQTVGKCRRGEERKYHDRANDLLQEFQFSVWYEVTSEDGRCRPDLLVRPSKLHDLFIFECKALKKINNDCINQLRRYVDTFGCTFGCLVNFGVWPPELFLMQHRQKNLDQILATEDIEVAKTSATKDAMENYINVPSGFNRTPQGNLYPIDIQDGSKHFSHIQTLEDAKLATVSRTKNALGKYINTPSGFTERTRGGNPLTNISGGLHQISSGLSVAGIPPPFDPKIYKFPKTNRRNGVSHRSGSQLRARGNKKDDISPLGFTKRLCLTNKADLRFQTNKASSRVL
jgi:hypothetical protein